MFPGLGKGMSPRKMQQMMKQMGIRVTEIENVEEVIIRTADSEIVFDDAAVSIMEAAGTKIYQLTGSPHERARELSIPEEDVKLVIEQTGASEDTAREALKEAGGDLADAIMRLSG
ncbi:MAG: nascent polypeptide-associated complex protein [Candidatus Syntropharchaeales archaeon]